MNAPLPSITNPAELLQTLDAALSLHQNQQFEQALTLNLQALAQAPQFTAIHYRVAANLLALGRLAEAQAHLQSALAADADDLDAIAECTRLAMAQGQPDLASQLLTRWAQRAPQDIRLLINRSGVALLRGDIQNGLNDAQQAVALAPQHPDAWNNLGCALHNSGQFASACQAFERALALAPQRAEIWQNLGDAQRASGLLQPALVSYENSLKINPRLASTWTNYGNLLGLQQRHAEALEAFSRAIACDPGYITAIVSRAGHLIEAGQEQDVISELAPRAQQPDAPPDVVAVYSYALRAAGRIDDAAEALLRHLPDNPAHRTLVYALGQLALARPQFLDRAVQVCDAWLQRSEAAAPQADRVVMRNLLANLLDKQGHYARAWQEAVAAKTAKSERSSHAAEQALAAALEQAFTARRLARPPYGLADERRPVLIVGMPRSGTSLLEQMLGQHPAVQACGELPELELIAQELAPGIPLSWPERAAQLPQDSLQALAQRYLHLLAPQPQARRITDKMPHNFVNLGLFHLLFPQGKVVHIERDPRDVAVSLMFHDFAGHHPYANHLEDIAHHILFYRRCMARWRAALPPGVLHELRYEDLVADPRGRIAAVLAHLDLPWDDAVLSPEQAARTVLTSSRFQVQEAIHRRAAGRWQRYARQLEPLCRLLDAQGALPA